MKRVCVFCGSSPGSRVEYTQTAVELGLELCKRGLGLVYGGGNVGLMGTVAKTVVAEGGHVTGVITSALASMEVAYEELADLRIVDSMHDRKSIMSELADGFIALPGGLGTFEEFLEILTWHQLGFHHKPCGLLNVCHYYDKFISFVDHATHERFIMPEHRSMILVSEQPKLLLDQFETYQAPKIDKAKWARRLSDR